MNSVKYTRIGCLRRALRKPWERECGQVEGMGGKRVATYRKAFIIYALFLTFQNLASSEYSLEHSNDRCSWDVFIAILSLIAYIETNVGMRCRGCYISHRRGFRVARSTVWAMREPWNVGRAAGKNLHALFV